MAGQLFHCHKALALSLACALALPLAAHAQSGTHEQQLEQRVAQLEQQLHELKQMIQAQQVTPAPNATPQNVAAAPATPAKPPVFSSAPGVSVAMHGFISATAFNQDKTFVFGNGQNAEWPVVGSRGSLSGVDVRNSRFWFDFSGAKFAGVWQGGGRIEADFFGGFNGTGAYSQQQATPRLRQAYMTLANPDVGSKVMIGQQWDLMFPLDMGTTSLAHIAFPLGYGTGMIGWRFPGAVWMQDLNHGATGPAWRLDLGAFEGAWSGPGNNINFLTAGNAGFRPQLEARLHVQDKTWLAFVSARYSAIDLRGVGGSAPTPIQQKITSVGYEVGASWNPGPWVFKGLVYSGNALGQIFGAMAQFGDIQETGGYVQAGFKFTPNWSANAIYSMVKPKAGDVITWLDHGSTGLLRNRQTALNLQYTSGAYDLGIEWMHDKLDSTSNGVDRKSTDGNQLSVSALYHF